MTAVALKPFAVETFEILAIFSGISRHGEMMSIGEAATLDDAIADGTRRTPHKQHFAIRVRNQLTGSDMLRIYVVKQRSRGERRVHYGEVRSVRDVFADHVVDLRGESL